MFAYSFRAIVSRSVFLRRLLIGPLTALSILVLPGCGSELNNHGGWLDAKLDHKWMIADTKQMRVLRAYVLIGSIARMAQTKYPSERELIVRHVNVAVQVVSDAYYCAYSQPGRCVYFDERMVEAEVAALRLLVAVLSDKEDEELFEAVSKQASKTFPLLKAVDSVSKLVDAVTSTGELAINAAQLIKSVIQAGQAAYFQGRRLGALYRDSIELEMLTVVSSLDTMCAVKHGGHYASYESTGNRGYFEKALTKDEQWAVDNFYGLPEELPETCDDWRKGYKIWRKGAGDLSEWKTYLSSVAVLHSQWIIPNDSAFIQASDLIWRACENLTSDLDQQSVCIGRAPIKTQGEIIECAIKTDELSVPEANRLAAQVENAATPDKAKRTISPWTDQCRLILYAQVVALRANRRGGADARLDWLSDLTPSPSHPIGRRPTYY
jgi:hypothetical protein